MNDTDITWKDVPRTVRALVQRYASVKRAAAEPWKVQDVLGPIADVTGIKPGPINAIWGGPRPLSNILAGAALGAGAGYGLGWLGEQLLPERYFERGKLRRTLSGLGALTGAIPGGLTAIDNLSRGHSLLAPWPPPVGPNEVVPDIQPVKHGSSIVSIIRHGVRKQYPDIAWFDSDKQAAAFDTGASAFLPIIPRDQFNNIVWEDPNTPMAVRAATTGIVEAASLARGNSPWVSPADVARIAASAGSGYLSGMMVGKTLGALAGLKPEVQQSLQSTGVWAGVLKGVMPIIFG